jgi:lipopolysaccharide/colanic/teichoic acid biosynthesis glycosyltransferase
VKRNKSQVVSLGGSVQADRIAGTNQESARSSSSRLRRVLDGAAAFVGLAVLSPVFALIAAAIKAEDGGPVFYSHPRVGQNFSRFGVTKFRTMVPNADRMGGPVTVAGDPRVTCVGRFLRSHKLDELPQLINVLRGEMSLVGPRPESEAYVAMFQAEYTPLLRHLPGITDPATLAFRDEERLLSGSDVEKCYLEEILPRKLELSGNYLQSRTLFSDLKVLVQTLLCIVRPRSAAGAYASSVQYGTKLVCNPEPTEQDANAASGGPPLRRKGTL